MKSRIVIKRIGTFFVACGAMVASGPHAEGEVTVLPPIFVTINIVDLVQARARDYTIGKEAWGEAGDEYDGLFGTMPAGEYYMPNVWMKVCLPICSGYVQQPPKVIAKKSWEGFRDAILRAYDAGTLDADILEADPTQGGLVPVGSFPTNEPPFCAYGDCNSGTVLCQQDFEGSLYCVRV